MFTVAEKGNSTVALKKSFYKNKMKKLFRDRSTYSRVKKSPLKKLQNEAHTLLKRCNENDFLKRK